MPLPGIPLYERTVTYLTSLFLMGIWVIFNRIFCNRTNLCTASFSFLFFFLFWNEVAKGCIIYICCSRCYVTSFCCKDPHLFFIPSLLWPYLTTYSLPCPLGRHSTQHNVCLFTCMPSYKLCIANVCTFYIEIFLSRYSLICTQILLLLWTVPQVSRVTHSHGATTTVKIKNKVVSRVDPPTTPLSFFWVRVFLVILVGLLLI